MNLEELKEKAKRGGISKEEALWLVEAGLNELRNAANELRQAVCGEDFDLCSIINGKSGKCPEDCKYCAQSAHYAANTEFYELLDAREILAAAQENERGGVRRFSIVTSGRRLTHGEVSALCAIYRTLKAECGLSLCASHGLLDDAQFAMLKAAGVERYHCNLETSRAYFPKVCTTHTYEDKLMAIRSAQKAGLSVCSGGIIGMGETMEDRIDMAFTLRDLGVRSVPLNLLNPVPGTPFEALPLLPAEEAERTAAIFRFILPDAQLRLAGGRINLKDRGASLMRSGVNAAITGDMLTTAGITIQTDQHMIRACGFHME